MVIVLGVIVIQIDGGISEIGSLEIDNLIDGCPTKDFRLETVLPKRSCSPMLSLITLPNNSKNVTFRTTILADEVPHREDIKLDVTVHDSCCVGLTLCPNTIRNKSPCRGKDSNGRSIVVSDSLALEDVFGQSQGGAVIVGSGGLFHYFYKETHGRFRGVIEDGYYERQREGQVDSSLKAYILVGKSILRVGHTIREHGIQGKGL